jgi:cell division protein FtsB
MWSGGEAIAALIRLGIVMVTLFAALVLFREDWLRGDELYFVVLALLSGIALFGGFRLALRQIDAEAREELIKARDEIVELRKRIKELEDAVPPANLAEMQGAQAAVSVQTQDVLDKITSALDKLPEKHRLAGLWASVGLALAVLAFLIAKDVSIGESPSQTDTTPTVTTPTEPTPGG